MKKRILYGILLLGIPLVLSIFCMCIYNTDIDDSDVVDINTIYFPELPDLDYNIYVMARTVDSTIFDRNHKLVLFASVYHKRDSDNRIVDGIYDIDITAKEFWELEKGKYCGRIEFCGNTDCTVIIENSDLVMDVMYPSYEYNNPMHKTDSINHAVTMSFSCDTTEFWVNGTTGIMNISSGKELPSETSLNMITDTIPFNIR